MFYVFSGVENSALLGRVAIAGEVGWSFFGFSPGLDRGKILTFHLFSVLQLFLINQTEDCF